MMTTLAEIEKAVSSLPVSEQQALLHYIEQQLHNHAHKHRKLPVIPATGNPITQSAIDEALETD